MYITGMSTADSSIDRQSQLDEVEILSAMSREGEFQWEEDATSGCLSGTLNVFLELETLLSLRMVAPIARKRHFPNKSTPLVLAGSPEAQKAGTPGKGACHRSETAAASVASTAPAVKSSSVLHLPPICLHFRFPPSYPSQEKPEFTLSCKWLNFTQVLCVISHKT